jgi:hypothetical protein
MNREETDKLLKEFRIEVHDKVEALRHHDTSWYDVGIAWAIGKGLSVGDADVIAFRIVLDVPKYDRNPEEKR